MIKFWQKCLALAMSVITIIFMFLPETIFERWKIIPFITDTGNIILNRIVAFIVVFFLVSIGMYVYECCRKKICIKGKGYKIQVQYGNILDESIKGEKIITFDECFTTVVGNEPAQIKPDSICGQYLSKFPLTENEMKQLIKKAHLVPLKIKSKYCDSERYEPGRIVPNGEYLLVAFSRLRQDGSGESINYRDYLDFLSTLWEEINKYYAQNDVYIPIIGSGITRIDSVVQPTRQELLDIMINSYKLSNQKIKLPQQLHIICERCEDFSLNKVGESL